VLPALNIAVSGMLDAANRLNGVASSVAKSTAAANAVFTVDAQNTPSNTANANPGSGGSLSTASLSKSTGSPLYVPSYAEDAVAMRQAVSTYKSNAKLLRTVADLARTLADEIKPR
jgi:hypothetical protein